MANPNVRPHLEFYPHDSGETLEHAYEGNRWKNEIDSHLLSPMIRQNDRDFFIYEPTLLNDGHVYLPTRWFKRGELFFAKAWRMRPIVNDIEGGFWEICVNW